MRSAHFLLFTMPVEVWQIKRKLAAVVSVSIVIADLNISL